MGTIHDLQQKLASFADDRDWSQFHTPKNLCCSISIEAAELLEIFQWQDPRLPLDESSRERAGQEIADVFIYLLMLSRALEIDLEAATHDKIRLNALKYPIDKSKGNCKKHSEFTE